MSTDFEDNARLTFIGIWSSATIAIGAAFMAAGIGILYGLFPLFSEARKSGFDNFDLGVINTLQSSSVFFIWGGLTLIILSVIASRVYIRNLKLKKNNVVQQNDISCKCFISFPHCQIYDEIEKINLR